MSSVEQLKNLVQDLKLKAKITQTQIVGELKLGIKAPSFNKVVQGRDKNSEEKAGKYLGEIAKKYPQYVQTDEKGNYHFKDGGVSSAVVEDSRQPRIYLEQGAPSFKEVIAKELRKKKGKGVLKIIDTWIPQFLEEEGSNIPLIVEQAGKIQILILNPASPLVEFRRKALGIEPGEAQLKLLRNIKDLYANREAKVEVRLYDELPGYNLYILDEVIFYGGFLSFDYSQNTFFHRVSYGEHTIAQQLEKHFQTLWEKRSQPITKELLDWLDQTDPTQADVFGPLDKEVNERLAGTYVLYNLDDDLKKPFQVSKLEINAQKGGARIHFKERRLEETSSLPVKVEIIDRRHLLISGRKKNFILYFLGFIGSQKFPEIIKLLYLHGDAEERSRASFALLQRVEWVGLEPRREPPGTTEIDVQIKEFLLQDQRRSLQIVKPVYRMDDLLVERSAYYRVLEKYVGRWRLYCHQRYSNVLPALNQNQWIGAVANSVFILEKDLDSGDFKCMLEIEGYQKYHGTVLYKGLLNLPYLIFELFNDMKDRYLNFILFRGFAAEGQADLFGTFNTNYPRESDIGSGFVLLKRDIEENLLPPTTINPIEAPKELAGLMNFLAFRETSSLLLDQNRRALTLGDSMVRYAGVYRLYSYGRLNGESKKCVTVAAVRIHPFGYVEFRGFRNDFLAEGHVNLFSGSLHFRLRNKNSNRFGYMIFYAGQFTPGPGVLFTGLFLGISIRGDKPIASRLVLEYAEESFDQISTGRVPLFSEDYHKVPKEIRKFFTGRTGNLIGFFPESTAVFSRKDLKRLRKNQLSYGDLFMQSACYQLLHSEEDSGLVEKVLVSLKRAVEHGFRDLDDFKNRIKESPHQEMLFRHSGFQELEKWVADKEDS